MAFRRSGVRIPSGPLFVSQDRGRLLRALWAGQPLREAGCCSRADPVLGVEATVACLPVYLPIAVAVTVAVADSVTLTGRLHTQVGCGCRAGGFVRGRGGRVVLRIDVGLRGRCWSRYSKYPQDTFALSR